MVAGWIGTGLVGAAGGAEAAILRPSLGTARWRSASGAPSAMGSEERFWALVMDVLCLSWEGSGLEGSVAFRWVPSDPGTMRLVRISVSAQCIGSERSGRVSGAVRARSGSRRWSVVMSSLFPSGR